VGGVGDCKDPECTAIADTANTDVTCRGISTPRFDQQEWRNAAVNAAKGFVALALAQLRI
jgi:hypothetical protein